MFVMFVIHVTINHNETTISSKKLSYSLIKECISFTGWVMWPFLNPPKVMFLDDRLGIIQWACKNFIFVNRISNFTPWGSTPLISCFNTSLTDQSWNLYARKHFALLLTYYQAVEKDLYNKLCIIYIHKCQKQLYSSNKSVTAGVVCPLKRQKRSAFASWSKCYYFCLYSRNGNITLWHNFFIWSYVSDMSWIGEFIWVSKHDWSLVKI